MFKTIMKFTVVLHFLSPVGKKHDLLKTVPLHPFQLKQFSVSGPAVVGEFGVQQVDVVMLGLHYMGVQHVDVVEYVNEGGGLPQEEPSNKTTQMMDGNGKE